MNSYKIMIVDDDKKILKFLKDFLEKDKYFARSYFVRY